MPVLLRLPVDLPALSRIAEQRGMTRRGLMDEGLVLHHLLAECFGKGAVQPFRLMPAPGGRKATLYGYTTADPAALRDMAATVATPDISAVLRPADLQDKPLPMDILVAGKRLGFDLFVRPVVRLHRSGAERDAFQIEAERTFPDRRGAMTESGRTRREVYLDWLQSRLGKAARLEPVTTRLARFQRRRVLRGGRAIEGPDAIFHGTLSITDASVFARILATGIGRHRAYGYGMILLRPPQRALASAGG